MANYNSRWPGPQIDQAVGLALNPDTTPASGSTDLITSGGVFNAVQTASPAITETASGALVHITDASAAPATSVVAEIVATQDGSGTPSPGNPRAINGFTAANVTHIGKNLLHNIAESKTQNGVTFTVNSDGSVTVSTNGAATANTFLNLDYTGALSTAVDTAITGVDLTASGNFSSDCGIFITYFKADGTNANIGSYYADRTFQFPSDAVKMRISLRVNSGVNIVTPITVYPQIELGGTATAYEKYTGDTENIDWTADAGTVYGGSLDVTTGVLTVTMGYIASYAGETINEPWISSIDEYVPNTSPSTGAEVAYTLATPQTYQLTAEEVDTLLGINNIWADTGDITVVYRADTSLFIASKVPDAPTTDGTYTLTCTVSSGVATYSWA